MNKLATFTLLLVSLSQYVNAEVDLKYFQDQANVFEVQAPLTWKQNHESKSLSISSPGGDVAITASSYNK